MEKSEIRLGLKNLRNNFSKSEHYTPFSQIISEKILPLIPSKNIFLGCYYPSQGEVDISYIFKFYKNKLFPLLIDDEMSFCMADLEDLDKHPKYNFMQPKNNNPAIPDYILIPGIGFDESLNRIGHGKGHFDKYLAKLLYNGHNPIKIGVCFEFQVLKRLPTDKYDIKMDYVVTEKGLYR